MRNRVNNWKRPPFGLPWEKFPKQEYLKKPNLPTGFPEHCMSIPVVQSKIFAFFVRYNVQYAKHGKYIIFWMYLQATKNRRRNIFFWIKSAITHITMWHGDQIVWPIAFVVCIVEEKRFDVAQVIQFQQMEYQISSSHVYTCFCEIRWIPVTREGLHFDVKQWIRIMGRCREVSKHFLLVAALALVRYVIEVDVCCNC